jgi:aromatic ring-opening dioxygenase LigB subunit
MLSLTAIVPHPPLIVPGIGDEAGRSQVTKTIAALKNLARLFQEENPATIIVIAPHAPLLEKKFLINQAAVLEGDFLNFGVDQKFSYPNNSSLLEKIATATKENDLGCSFYKDYLDYSALVPLSYIAPKFKSNLVHLSFSFLSFEQHYLYGKLIDKIIQKEKNKIAVLASGDLSHRITPDAPAGYSPLGKEFDKKLISFLENRAIKKILNLDPSFIQEAGECGLRSLIILLGILDKIKYQFKTLSYEAPFGVGYLVGHLKH